VLFATTHEAKRRVAIKDEAYGCVSKGRVEPDATMSRSLAMRRQRSPTLVRASDSARDHRAAAQRAESCGGRRFEIRTETFLGRSLVAHRSVESQLYEPRHAPRPNPFQRKKFLRANLKRLLNRRTPRAPSFRVIRNLPQAFNSGRIAMASVM